MTNPVLQDVALLSYKYFAFTSSKTETQRLWVVPLTKCSREPCQRVRSQPEVSRARVIPDRHHWRIPIIAKVTVHQPPGTCLFKQVRERVWGCPAQKLPSTKAVLPLPQNMHPPPFFWRGRESKTGFFYITALAVWELAL